MAEPLKLAAGAVLDADERIQAFIAIAARDLLAEKSGYIERRLLEGCNRLVIETTISPSRPWRGVKQPQGVLSRTLYEIPRWRDQPKTRLRIWLARRRYRSRIQA